jgi:hypothetical protein
MEFCMNQSEVAIQVPRSYTIEICAVAASLLLVLPSAIFCLYGSVSINKGLVFNEAFLKLFGLGLVCGLFTFLLIKIIVDFIIEQRLYQNTKDRELIFTDDSLQISIGLLVDRKILKQMRENNQSYFDIKYDEILEAELCDSVTRIQQANSPPYYKLTVKNRTNPIFIVRGSTYFGTNEDRDNQFGVLIKERTSANISNRESAEEISKIIDKVYFVVAVIFFLALLYILRI